MTAEDKSLLHIPPQSGIAFTLEKGQRMRVIDVEGEQVSDLVCFAHNEPSEHFSSGRTVDYNGKLFMTAGDMLYSNRSRAMMTIVADRVGNHTCLYAPCSQEMFEISYGVTAPHPNCLDNLNTNLAPFGLNAQHIAAPFNIFMHVTVSPEGQLAILPPRSKAGDYLELQAEMDLIVGLTACSAGACNNYHCTPIDVEILPGL